MKTYKTLIIKFIVFVALFIIIDLLCGYIFRLLENKALQHSPYGMITEYTMEKVNTDIVIIGASEANHSYVCSIIEDSLNMSVFNCGKDGCRFWYQNAMVNGILDRYAPKIIIWSVSPSFLSTPSEEDHGNLSQLNPYYRTNDFCRKAILQKSKHENIKMYSNLYSYNSTIFEYIYRIFLPDYPYLKGKYAPLYGTTIKKQLIEREWEDDIDTLSYSTFSKTIKNCKDKGTEVIFVLTPRYELGNFETIQYQKLKEIISKQEFQIIEDLYHSENLLKPELFKDKAHLNNDGAQIFTKCLISKLRKDNNKLFDGEEITD